MLCSCTVEMKVKFHQLLLHLTSYTFESLCPSNFIAWMCQEVQDSRNQEKSRRRQFYNCTDLVDLTLSRKMSNFLHVCYIPSLSTTKLTHYYIIATLIGDPPSSPSFSVSRSSSNLDGIAPMYGDVKAGKFGVNINRETETGNRQNILRCPSLYLRFVLEMVERCTLQASQGFELIYFLAALQQMGRWTCHLSSKTR